MSRLRANQITNENANGAPNFPHGLTVTGIITATNNQTTFNDIVVGSAVTANSQGIDVTGIVTATQFKGDGSVLTGIDASSLKNGSDVKVQANSHGAVVTGILTATSPGAGIGKVLQIKHAIKTDIQNFGSISQGGETSIPFVASITPTSATSKLLVQMMITMDNSTTHGTYATAKKTTGGVTTEPAVGNAAGSRHRITTGTNDNSSGSLRNIYIMFVDTAGTTNQIDYGFTLSHNDNSTVNIYLNYSNSDADASYTGRGVSSITVTEFTE